MPAGAATANVTVTTSSETSATSANDQFTYVPSVTSVNPSSGPASGGSVVTIDGSGFSTASTVEFGTDRRDDVAPLSRRRRLPPRLLAGRERWAPWMSP